MLPAGWFVLTILLVLIMRFVPPVTSAVIVEQHIASWLDASAARVHPRHWVPMREISPVLPLALVAAEDQRFPFHHGFDFGSIDQAIHAADRGRRLRGASTLSQQTAKNLFLWTGRSYLRKGLEAYFTVLIEALWPKQRILEVYMNIAQFGDGIYGVEAASRDFYHHSAASLSPTEAARLAAVLPNPSRFKVDHPSAYVGQRVEWIQQQMQQLGGTAYLPFLRRH
ncbi:monofunctional biosynthetic peptidoglycan transglycosylase [Frateuria aurantia]